MDQLEADLARFYDQDAEDRAVRERDPRRVECQESFARLLLAERRRSILEVGTGPGRDAQAFMAHGLKVSGVDLSAEHVRLCAAAGVEACLASVHHLPFPDDTFDAGWTMSTLIHVPDAEFDAAMREVRRVLTAGSPLAVGLWGGSDSEGIRVEDDIHPRRFFSKRSNERVQTMLAEHGSLEQFDTWSPGGQGTYQFAVLRVT